MRARARSDRGITNELSCARPWRHHRGFRLSTCASGREAREKRRDSMRWLTVRGSLSSFRVEVDGEDEDSKMFRTARTEVVDGVDDAVVPVLSVGVWDVEEVEGVMRVCSARTETRHSPLSTAALCSAASPKTPNFRGEAKGSERGKRRRRRG